MFVFVDVPVLAIPVTTPTPVPLNSLTEFFAIRRTPTPLPWVMPVIAPPLVMLLTVLPVTVVGPPSKLVAIPVTEFVPPVILLTVLPITFLVGAPPLVL